MGSETRLEMRSASAIVGGLAALSGAAVRYRSGVKMASEISDRPCPKLDGPIPREQSNPVRPTASTTDGPIPSIMILGGRAEKKPLELPSYAHRCASPETRHSAT